MSALAYYHRNEERQKANNGSITKLCFSSVRSRQQIDLKYKHITMIAGHGIHGEYLHRSKISDDFKMPNSEKLAVNRSHSQKSDVASWAKAAKQQRNNKKKTLKILSTLY